MSLSRKIIACTMLVFACSVYAQNLPPQGNGSQRGPNGHGGKEDAAQFDQHKQHELARIQARLQTLQNLQSCVQSATDPAAMRTCHQNARTEMKNMGEGHE